MVYKRYIYRDGKKFGPYYYESYRDKHGIARTKYVQEQDKNRAVTKHITNKRSFKGHPLIFVLLGAMLLVILGIIFLNYQFSQSGESGVEQKSITFKGLVNGVYSFITGMTAEETGETPVEEPTAQETAQEETPQEPTVEQTVEQPEETTVEETVIETETQEEPLEETPSNEIAEEPIEEIPPSESELEQNTTEEEINETIIEEPLNITEIEENITETPENITEEQPLEENMTEEPEESEGFFPVNQTNITISNETITNVTINETLENVTIINETISNITVNISIFETTKQYGAVLGIPVKWEKNVKIFVEGNGSAENLVVDIPEIAKNISVKKLSKGTEEGEKEIKISIKGEKKDFEVKKQEKLEEKINETFSDENVTETEEFNKTEETAGESLLTGIFNFFIGLIKGTMTGSVVETPEQNINIEINEPLADQEEVIVEYYTDAPYSVENEINNGKEVQIIGPEEVHYENVLVFTNLSESLNIKNKGRVTIYWIENNTYVTPESVEDFDENGIYDYVSWIVPHLSNQTFNIIVITKAEHLDENRTFVSDIYEQVKELDDIWSETIPSEHYVRVTFERNLSSENDITIYPRALSGAPRIEVYEVDGSDIIAEFENLNDNEYNKVLLTSLLGSQDTFDLKVVDGSVEFDHIVDPSATGIYNFSGITNPSSTHVAWNGFYNSLTPPLTWPVMTEFTTANYTNVSNLGDNSVAIYSIDADVLFGTIRLSIDKFRFKISENKNDVTSLQIFFNGTGGQKAVSKTTTYLTDVNISIWNVTGSSWYNLMNCTATSSSTFFTYCYIDTTLTSGLTDFFDANNNISIKVQDQVGAPPGATTTYSMLYIDFIQLVVNSSVDNPPTTYLESPETGTTDTDGNMTFVCNATDDTQLDNISLYTNTTGTWALNQTRYTGETQANTSSIVALLHLNNNVNDDSGYSNDGTLYGGLGYIAGNFYQGLDFVGDVTKYVTIPDQPYFSPANNDFTILMWVNSDDTLTRKIAAKGGSGGSDWEWILEQENIGRLYTRFSMYNLAGSNRCGANNAGTLTAGVWHLIGGSYDGTNCYAILDTTVTSAVRGTDDLGDGISPVYLGKRGDGSGSEYDGQMDEVMIFNRSLSSAEISAIYNYNRTFYNASFNLNDIADGGYNWNCQGTDNISQSSFASSNWTFIVNTDSTNPIATQGTNPVPAYNDTDGSITFDLKCSDNKAVNTLQLWGNWTGTWSANQTNSTPINNTYWNVTVANIPNGNNFVWGVYCNDTSGNSNWSTNRTFNVDKTPPTTMLISPADGSNNTNGNVAFSCNATDNLGLANVSLYTNTTGSWALNQTYYSSGTMIIDSTYDIADVYAQEDSGDWHYYELQMRWDISNIPKNATISNATLCLYITNGALEGNDGDANFSSINNQTWDESISAAGYNTQTENNITNVNSWNSSGGWSCINISNAVITDYNLNNNYTSFRIEDNDYVVITASDIYDTTLLYFGSDLTGETSADHSLNFASREYTADTTKRPYLLITYSFTNVTTAEFDNNLPDGNYIWNCLAYDSFGNSDWGDANRTLNVEVCDLNQISSSTTLTSGGCEFYNITSDNVVFDCGSNTIYGNNSATYWGIEATNRDNVTIKNCNLQKYAKVILLNNTVNSNISNNILYNNSHLTTSPTTYGIYLKNSNNTNIEYNNITRLWSNSTSTADCYSYTGAVYAVYVDSSNNLTYTNNSMNDINGQYFGLFDIEFPCGYIWAGTGVYVDSAGNSSLLNFLSSNFTDIYSYGMYFKEGNTIFINDSNIIDTGTSSIYFDSTYSDGNVNLYRNTINYTGGSYGAFYVDSSSFSDKIVIKDNNINHGAVNTKGIYIQGSITNGIEIIGNTLTNFSDDFIYSDSDNSNISDNILMTPAFDETNDAGIHMGPSVSTGVINNNTLFNFLGTYGSSILIRGVVSSISNNNITNCVNGIRFFNPDNLQVWNTTITNCTATDILDSGSLNIGLYNVSFNKSKVSVSSGSVQVYYNYRTNVTDQNYEAVETAKVNVSDRFGTSLATSDETNVNGLTVARWVMEYNQTGAAAYVSGCVGSGVAINCSTPHNVTASKIGYSTNSSNITIDENKRGHLVLTTPYIQSYIPTDDTPSIAEPGNETFSIIYANTTEITIRWFVNSSEETGSVNTSQYIWVGNYSQSGTYEIKVNISNEVGEDEQVWILTVNDTPASIDLDLLYPIGDINVSQYSFFNTTLNVTCQNADCGTINVSLAYEVGDCYDNTRDPIPICTCDDLNLTRNNLSGNYELWNNIDFSACDSSYTSGSGWIPVGDDSTQFTGTFDGQNHTISNLYVFRTSTDYIGLFGYSYGTIKNVGLIDMNLSGQSYIGGVAGRSHGAISKCYTTGLVNGTLSEVAGIVAYNFGDITNCYSTVNVTGNLYEGGLVGFGWTGSSIQYSYFAGDILTSGGGGLLGYDNGVVITASYYDINNVSVPSPGNVIGNETWTNMTNTTWLAVQGWDFTSNWSDVNNLTDYPLLKWEGTALANGLVIIGEGFPFYTNASSNPQTTIVLNKSDSQTITFWVNATGTVASKYEFVAYSNMTSYMSISNITDAWNVTIDDRVFSVAIDLSPTLLQQIFWNLTSLPISSQAAPDNDEDTPSDSLYYVNISVTGGTADLYMKASGDLGTSGGDILGLGNETFKNSTDGVTWASVSTLTTDYADNKIGGNLGNGAIVYLNYYISAPSAQAAGDYNNTLYFKAVKRDVAP